MKINEQASAVQMAAGLPPVALFERRLLYDPGSRSIILSCTTSGEGGSFRHVFVRHAAETRYEPVAQFWADAPVRCAKISAHSPIVADGSLLYCLLSEHGRIGEHESVSSVGVFKLDLSARRGEIWRTETWFATELVGPGVSPLELYAIIGTPAPERNGRVSYTLGTLSWSAQTCEAVAGFDRIFF